jgi:hypothetical protein
MNSKRSRQDQTATKRNPNQVKDFAKKRLKVGAKKKLPARTATKAIARTRVIALPPQTLRTERAAVATHRNVTLSELLVQCAHFAHKTRRDALTGVRELLQSPAHCHVVANGGSLHAMLDRLLAMIADEAADVRKALAAALDALWAAAEPRVVAPFANLIVAHFCAALTHMHETVRVEALALLNRFLAAHPAAAAPPPLWVPLCSCFDSDGLLALAITGRSAVRPAIRDSVLGTLDRLLDVALRHTDGGLAPAASGAPLTIVRSVDAAADATVVATSPAQLDAFVLRFGERGVPTLLQCWLESVPAEPRPSVVDLTRMRAVLHVLLRLLRVVRHRTGARVSREHLAAEWRRRFLRNFEQYVFVHFPLLAPDTSDGNGVDNIDDTRLGINVAIAELMVMFLPLPVRQQPAWIAGKLLPFVESMFRAPLNARRAATVAPLLDVAQTLIDDLGSDAQRLQLFDAFACFFKALQPAAPIKRVCVALLRRIVDRSTPDDTSLPELELIIGCVVALPRMLWQLKDSDVDASLSLLDTMLAFAHRHARQRNALALLESGLQPLFFTYRRDNNAPLFGPFVLLPDALQRRALDLARYVLEATHSDALVRAIAACCVTTTAPPRPVPIGVVLYALETLQCAVPSELQISFAMTILQQSQDADDDVRWSKRLPLVRYVARSLGAALGAHVLDAMLDAMLTAWLQGEHVLEIEAALLLAVQLRRKLPRLAPLYARGVALHALAHAGGVQPWAWLLDTHDALLLQCIDALLQHGAPSSQRALQTLSDCAQRWKLAHGYAPLPEPQASNVRAFATLGAEHFSDSAARLLLLAE